MTTRGWYKERTLTTVDTVGREVSVTTGLTRDPEGRLVAAIAISDGRNSMLRPGFVTFSVIPLSSFSACSGDRACLF